MLKNSIFLSVLLLTTACAEEDMLIKDEVYQGYFYRTTNHQQLQTAEVTLDLSGSKFAGLSSEQNYPAICSGTLIKSKKQLIFQNECVFTADFDWSYVLNGTYDITDDEENIYFVQEVSDGTFNIFRFPK